MRLALISGEFPPMQGGVGDYTRELAREFVRRGIHVRIITRHPPSPPSLLHKRERGVRTPSPFQGEGWGEGESLYALHHTNFHSFRSLPQVDALTRDCDLRNPGEQPVRVVRGLEAEHSPAEALCQPPIHDRVVMCAEQDRGHPFVVDTRNATAAIVNSGHVLKA